MSDVQSPQPGADAAPARDGVAAGRRLKQAREAAGLHVVALAAALKVPVKKLEALEAGRTADLPDATFARALAASVCRQLKIDPAEVLALLPQAASSRLGEDAVLNTPFRYGPEGTGPSRAGPGSVPRVVGACLVLLAVWTSIAAWRGDFPHRERQQPAPVLWIIAGLALQLMLLKFAGFSIATGLMFAFTARAFGKRNLALSIPVGIAFSFVVWAIFSQLLMLHLPAGPLEHLFFPGG